LANEVAPQDRVLDWVPRHDPRSLQYPVRTLFKHPEPMNMTWRTPSTPLDQGREGACVGFGWVHEALTTPVRVDIARMASVVPRNPTDFALYVYRQAQRIDEWEGEDYEGTSVLAGAKIMQDLGLLREYRWAFGVMDVALAVTNVGPVVIGIPWYDSMYESKGIVEVHGSVVGGHCLLVMAYRKAGAVFENEAAFGLFNSWGPGWGRNGLAWIRQSSLARLLADRGEACVPTRRSFGRA
jgi:hypothetical protein